MMATWATRDRAEAAEARVVALEDRLREAVAILRFHNRTATGLTIKCLTGCIACEFVAASNPGLSKPICTMDCDACRAEPDE